MRGGDITGQRTAVSSGQFTRTQLEPRGVETPARTLDGHAPNTPCVASPCFTAKGSSHERAQRPAR
jgi:hypothetical protein